MLDELRHHGPATRAGDDPQCARVVAVQPSPDGVELRILTARGRREQARYAMEVTQQPALFRRLLRPPYMRPSSTSSHPGCAARDESALPDTEPRSSTIRVARRRGRCRRCQPRRHDAHLVRNLVTAAWCDDLWLNEAFATWMAEQATERFNPDWDLKRGRVPARRMPSGATPAARRDRWSAGAHRATRCAVFDEITYQKGGSAFDVRTGARRRCSARASPLHPHARLLERHRRRPLRSPLAGGVAGTSRARSADGSRVRAFRSSTSPRVASAGAPRCARAARFSSQSLRELAAMWHVPVVLARTVVRPAPLTLGRSPPPFTSAAVPVIANAGDTGYYAASADARGRCATQAGVPTAAGARRAASRRHVARRARRAIADYRGACPRRARRRWLLLVAAPRRSDEAVSGARAGGTRAGRARGAPQLTAWRTAHLALARDAEALAPS